MEFESDSVLISALQKFIRRCDLNGALYTAQLLCNDNNDYQRWHRLWRRLIVISSEDIGIAQKGVFKYLQKQLIKINTNKESRLFLTLNAVKTLAYAKKSRLTDHAVIYYGQKIASDNNTTNLDLYDIIYKNPIDEAKLLYYITYMYIKDRKLIKDCWKAIRNICTDTEEFDNIYFAWEENNCILFLLHACLLITRDYKSEQIIELDITSNSINHNVTVPDYVYDMHTTEGRKLGRDFKHFIEVSCKINNQPIELIDIYYNELVKKFVKL